MSKIAGEINERTAERLKQQLEMAEAIIAADGALITGLKNDLAAALAACKLKDEALKDEYDYQCANYDEPNENLAKALAIQPDDAALKTWLEMSNTANCRPQ